MSLSEKTSLPDHGQRRQAIVGSLLRDVFRGHFHAGQHLVTRELADRFGVSHTPVREALISLAGIGVVDLLPNRGAVVRRITPRIVAEICQVRCVLECEAVRSACGRIERAPLEILSHELRYTVSQRADSPRFMEQARAIDSRLHDLIAASCGNAFLAGELSRLKSLFRAFRDLSWEHAEAHSEYHRIAEEAAEHLAIVDALLSEKRHEAVRAMSRHINSGIHYWSRSVEQPASEPALLS